MKTTNFEISKKLKEAGFDAEFYFHYKSTDHCNLYDNGYEDYKDRNTPAYDLETLLDALPDSIQYKSSDWYYLFLRAPSRFSETNKTLGYYCECNEYMDNYRMGEEHGIFEVSKLSPNESLADTAGRLLLLLHEKNLIKF